MSTAHHLPSAKSSTSESGASLVLATAGHVDHGKTSLVKRLTGTDTDTLAEEKKRGLTINLGFAYHQFTDQEQPEPGHHTLGFVDVPGHTDFINNMLAGVGSVDSALLIVAADDGIMPQTLEHLAILHLLSITLGAVVITKIDRADAKAISALIEEIGALLKRFGMAEVPVFQVCAPTGEGIEPLRQHLQTLAIRKQAEPSEFAGAGFRYLVDRSFSVTGFGTVVTGSARAGRIHAGDKLFHSGSDTECRIKSMRIHETDVDELVAGSRAALNINLPWQSVGRGDWLTELKQPTARTRMDARLQLLDTRAEIRSSAEYHLFIGASHRTANLRWLDQARGLAQLLVHEPVYACCGDRFIVRDPAATQTLGGGRVIDVNVPRRGRSSEQRLDFLNRADNEPLAALRELLPSLDYGLNLDEFLSSRNLKQESLEYFYDELKRAGIEFEILKVKFATNPWLMDYTVFTRHRDSIVGQLEIFHQQFPAQPGISESSLNQQLGFPGSHLVLNAILARLLEGGVISLSGTSFHLPNHRAQLSEEEKQFLGTIKPILEQAGSLPPRTRELAEQTGIALRRLEHILRQATKNGHLIQIAGNRYFLPETVMELATLAEYLAREVADDEGFTVIGFRDRSGLGRNLCIEILEYFDGIGFTRRDGNQRFIRTTKENIFSRK